MQRALAFFRRLLTFRNAAALATILIAVGASLNFRPFGISYETDQIILGLLALIAIDTLVERLDLLRNIDNTSTKALDMIQTIASPDAESVLRGRQTMYVIPKATRAREIWACGYSLITMIRENESYLANRLDDGCSLRFMMLNPDIEIVAWLDGIITPQPGELIGDIRSSLARLERIVATAKRSSKSRLSVHLLKTLPSYSIVVVDRNTPEGWVQVGIYPTFHKQPIDASRPHLVLSNPSGVWYQFFCSQFQMLWDDSRYSDHFELKPIGPAAKQ